MAVEIVTRPLDGDVDEAVRRLVNTQHFRAGSIVSMPVMYPSGASVVLEITLQKERCFITDRGGGALEADLFGAGRYFRHEAEKIASAAGISFDGRDMFIAEVPRESLQGAMTAVANSSAEAVNIAAYRQAERSDHEVRDELFTRLSSIYRAKRVEKDAKVKSAHHEWRVSVLVSDARTKALFEPVSSAYITVVGTAAKFHDFARMQTPPLRFAVVKSRTDLGDYFGVVAASADKVIPMSASDETFRKLLEAA